MAYFKYGIVVKIEMIKNYKNNYKYLSNCFNLNLYNKIENGYLIKENVLSSNVWKFREEVLDMTNGLGDSFYNCEAYCLNKTINELSKSDIKLCNNNEKYYFSCFVNYKFQADELTLCDEEVSLKLFLIPIFWDINSICFDNFNNMSLFINKLARQSMSNILKDASFFGVI